MPDYITVRRVGIWLDEVEDQEDADYAESHSPIQGYNDHTVRSLIESLKDLTAEISGLRVATSYRDEDDHVHILSYKNGEACDGRPQDAPKTDRRLGTRTAAPAYAALTAAQAAADAAINADDLSGMLTSLDDPRLTLEALIGVRHPVHCEMMLVETRFRLWRAIMVRPRDLPLERILRAFAEEEERVAHIVAYKLYIQTHLLAELQSRFPSDNEIVERRVAQAIAEWPDYPGRGPQRPYSSSLATPIHRQALANAIDEAVTRGAASRLGEKPTKRRSAKETQAFRATALLVREAKQSSDLTDLLSLLEAPTIADQRGDATRDSLWRAILSIPRPSLTMARVLRAFAEDVDDIVRAIGQGLYRQAHLEADLCLAAQECFGRSPKPPRLLSCISYAARRWSRLTIPSDFHPGLTRLLLPDLDEDG